MAYNEKEIIKKIEAETRNEKLIPTVLSSKRSAFLNKGRLGSSTNCGDDCQGVILTGAKVGSGYQSSNSGLFYYDHYANNYTQLSVNLGIESREDVARWDNKIYVKQIGRASCRERV